MKKFLVGIALCFQAAFSNGQEYFFVQDSLDNFGILDTSNRVLLTFNYQSVENMADCFLLTDKSGKKGVLSKSLKEILPCKFEKVKGDCSDWIVAKMNGEYGYYDTLGNLLFNHKYLDASLFKGDSALVMYESGNEIKLVWINRNGIEISKGNINQKTVFNERGKVRVTSRLFRDVRKKRKHYGIFIGNNWVIPPMYESIECIGNVFYIVEKNHLKGLFNRNGVMIFPIIYKDIRPRYR